MAKPKSKPSATKQPSPYELMAARLQKIINAPAVQLARSALLYKQPEESQEDWERILEEIAESDNVKLARRDDGAVQVSWTVQMES